jgi:hypothetical protein
MQVCIMYYIWILEGALHFYPTILYIHVVEHTHTHAQQNAG